METVQKVPLLSSCNRLNSSRVLVFVLCITCYWAVPKQVCVDLESALDCLKWREAGYCQNESNYTEFMTYNCNDTCNVCGDTTPVCETTTQFKCLEGYPVCVPILKMCDGTKDCEDGWDEEDCEWEPEHKPTTFKPITIASDNEALATEPPADDNPANATIQIIHEQDPTEPITIAVNKGMKCPSGMMRCKNKCIRTEYWCDGWMDDCADAEDEDPNICYIKPNKAFLKHEYLRPDVEVNDFLSSLLNMKHTHCTARHYSCKNACTRTPNLNTYLCACDPDCFARRDCCPDVVKQCKYEIPSEPTERCIPKIFGSNTDITALMIDECPNTATERHSRLCILANKNNETLKQAKYLGAPVYSQENGKHYRNFYCAKCNNQNEDKLLPWNIWYDCQSTESDFDVKNNCKSIVYVPPSSLVKTCKINKFTEPSFDEAIVTLEQRTAIKYCKSVYAPVMYNKEVYRNPYCYFIHRTQLGEKDKKKLFSCDIENKIKKRCPEETIPCRSTFTCLDKSKECDGVIDCEDASDEPIEKCRDNKCYGRFQCKINQHLCFDISKVCDGFTQCPDQSDEANCTEIDESEHINRGDIYYTLPELANYPTLTNNYQERFEPDAKPDVEAPQELHKKEPKCIAPLIFDGVMCKYNKTLTTDNQDYQKVYMKQDFNVITFNISLTDTGYYRPEALKDNTPEFLTRHSGHYPYQITDYRLDKSRSATKFTGYLSIRLLTQLEQSANIGNYPQTVRDKEAYVQINNRIYYVDMSGQRHYSDASQKPDTVIQCQHKDGGPRIQVICTGCAYIEYSDDEYTIAEDGKLKLNSNGMKLNYEDYELRENGKIILCWETLNRASGHSTKHDINRGELDAKKLRVWFCVGYATCVILNLAALNINVFCGHKTTLRVFFINYSALSLLWSFDSLLCAASSSYSDIGGPLHLYGCLGTLAWLIIISFHLLLSVSDANPAVYYSVDNLMYYHVCGWLCPFAWVMLFFVLSKCGIIEKVESISDPRSIMMSQSGEILHFPIWVVLLVIFFLLLTVIGITKKLLSEQQHKTQDLEVLTCRLKIKMLILGLFFISAIPWISVLGVRYWRFAYQYHVNQIIFCLGCLVQALYLIYIIKKLVRGNLEKLAADPTNDDPEIKAPLNSPNIPRIPAHEPILPIPLPPKQQRDNRPMAPLYQRPVEQGYTKFPGELPPRPSSKQQMISYNMSHGKEKYKKEPDQEPAQDQYSHLQGGVLGGQAYHANTVHIRRKEYYPMPNVSLTQPSTSQHPAPSYGLSESLSSTPKPEPHPPDITSPTCASTSPYHQQIQSDQNRLFSSATQLHYPSTDCTTGPALRPRTLTGSTTLAQVHSSGRLRHTSGGTSTSGPNQRICVRYQHYSTESGSVQFSYPGSENTYNELELEEDGMQCQSSSKFSDPPPSYSVSGFELELY